MTFPLSSSGVWRMTLFLVGGCSKWRSKRALWTWHFYDLSQMLLNIVGVFPLIFRALCIRLLFWTRHLCIVNNHDGNRVSLCSSCKHTSTQTLLSSMGVQTFDLFIFYNVPAFLPFLAIAPWTEAIWTVGSRTSLLGGGLPSCPAMAMAAALLPAQVRQAVPYLVKLPWTWTMLLPPLRFHIGEAESGLKHHYSHGCTT